MSGNARGRRLLPGRLAARLAVVLAILVAPGALAGCNRDGPAAEPPTTEPDGPQAIRLGALLPLTGDQAATGVAARHLLESRLAQLNQDHADDSAYTFELVVGDTESDPAVTQELFGEFADDGIKVMLGPFSNAELKAIQQLSNDRGVLLASPGSSAIAFSLEDNILRFVPDDAVQAAAIVDLLRDIGVRTVASIWRDDPGNAELRSSVDANLQALGGVPLEGFPYAPDATEYASVVHALSAEVTAAISTAGPGSEASMGVLLAGEDEVSQLLTLAAAEPSLGQVRWFGASGLPRDPPLVANPSAAEFATLVGLTAPSFGLDPGSEARWGPIVAEVEAQTGVRPDAVALAAYDALDVIVAAIVDMGFPAEDASRGEVNDLRQEALGQSVILEGVTGPLKLNELGDRVTGVFDFWSVCPTPDGYEWRRTAVWSPGPDGLTGGTITGPATC